MQLHGHRNELTESGRKLARSARLLSLLTGERERQPHHHAVHVVVARELGEPSQAPSRGRALHCADRGGERAGWVGESAAAARLAEVERENPAHTRARSIATRAAVIASGSFSGSRPPAWAMVSRPPPPPPAT